MSESSGAVATSGAVILEEPEGSGGAGGREQAPAAEQRPLRCALWPRQQTWLCVVPLLIGFIGLGLSLMLLKWIVVGSVRDYVPTDLVDAKGIGQDHIFFPKPSALPKGSDTTITTTIAANAASSSGPTASAAPRGRTRAGTHPGGSPTTRGGVSGSQVTQRGTTTRFSTRGPTFTTTTAASGSRTSSSPSPANPTVLNDSTQMWTLERSTERPVTTPPRTHVNRKTPAPTLPPLRSEHFKQCQDKDLAYCLNDGECFVIETLSGPHKHCRCREGYQGIRCDQFLPKTDSILSDPTDHLGIEFMESKTVYKRQVVSITCIAMGISLLGTLCMALYCRNKRRREKLQAHLKESRSLNNYSVNTSGLVSKSSLRPHPGLQLQNYCKNTRSSPPHGGAVCESSFEQRSTASPSHPRVSPTGKHHSPDQRSRTAHRTAPRRTPPIPRGRLNPIGGSRDSGPSYQHLQEVESSEREVESARRHAMRPASDLRQDSFHNMQASPATEPWGSKMELPSSHLDHRSSSRSVRGPSASRLSPPPYRSCSIPIIPSMQGHQDESSCMQTAPCSVTAQENAAGGVSSVKPHSSSSSSVAMAACKQEEVALLLGEAQEQLRALAHAQRKQEDSGGTALQEARETVCILLANGAGAVGVASNGPTETQLLSPRKAHKDCAQTGQ